jgi:hypothetical protein
MQPIDLSPGRKLRVLVARTAYIAMAIKIFERFEKQREAFELQRIVSSLSLENMGWTDVRG